MSLNLNQLRVFNAISDELSITGAAKRLRISQPAVSKQLAELEQSIGSPLVDRLPRGIQLTAAGHLLAEHARAIFQREQTAEVELARLLGLERGHLAVGASTTIGSYLVPPVLGDFHALHPDVGVELESGNTQAIIRALLDGQLDLGLTEGLSAVSGLDHEVLTHDEMVLIAGSQHPAARRVRIQLSELEGLAFIHREQGSGTREVIESELDRLGVRLTPAMSLGSTEAVKNAVVHGLGVAMVSRLTVELELRTGLLVALEVEGVHIRRALSLLTRRGKHPSPASAEFMRLLRARYPTGNDGQ
jgi:DNA-binding transcriptional LysR family regulator